MDERALDRLADLIAAELLRQTRGEPPSRRRPPEPGSRTRVVPMWSRPVGPIAPAPDTHLAAREAASRRGLGASAPADVRRGRAVALDPRAREVPIGVAARYVLLTDADWRALFGHARPTVLRELRQPGQFAYRETVRAVGPGGERAGVRVLGPFRERSRLALSRSDARRIGANLPVRQPGDFADAPPITLIGPAGSCTVPAVIAGAHLHLPEDQALRLGLRDGQGVSVRFGAGGRSVTLHGLPVLVGPKHRAELHLDADEANAAGVETGDVAVLTDLPGRPTDTGPSRRGRRPLLTERDVDALAARGEALSPSSPYLITPAARDRARYLGIWRERP